MIIRKCDQCDHTYTDGIVARGEVHYSLHCVTAMGYKAADLCSTECLHGYLADNYPFLLAKRPRDNEPDARRGAGQT